MSPASMNAAAAPGFFGKLPARGDFVSRRLRRDFLDPWDRWLQTAMATSREQLRENWLSRYLTSPLWRFALSPGVCGEQAYTGVLMPSVDRVGRYYPMAIALALETAPDPLGLIQTNWFEETERVALSGLDEDIPLEAFDGEVLALGAPALSAAGKAPDLVPSDRFDSESLLALPQLADLNGRRVLIVRGTGGRALLGNTLIERGAEVAYAEVYRRNLPEIDPLPLLARWPQDVQVATATSGEILGNLLTLVGRGGRELLLATPLVVVSERTATDARRLGFAQVELAERATDEAIVAAICRAIEFHKLAQSIGERIP